VVLAGGLSPLVDFPGRDYYDQEYLALGLINREWRARPVKYYTASTKDGREWTPSYSIGVDKEKCTGCGMCVDVCSRDVYVLIEHEGRKVADNPNAGNCVGDGSCNRVCPVQALK
jgi:NAD-dependent dihydropyrimidine dehydrogenase PreA subunit